MTAPASRGSRLSELGLRIGCYEPWSEAIPDLPGVAVGQVTVWQDEPDVLKLLRQHGRLS